MKVRIKIDKATAFRAGYDEHGYKVLDVPAANLNAAQRAFLAKLDYKEYSDKGPEADFYLDKCHDASTSSKHRTDVLQSYAKVEAAGLATVIDDLIEADRRRAEAEEKEAKEKYERRVALILNRGEDYFIWGDSTGGEWRLTNQNDAEVRHPQVKALYEQARAKIEARNAEVQRTKKVREQEEKLVKAKEEAERAWWITMHGSLRLKRLLAEGIECKVLYRDERLAAERPGWAWEIETDGEAKTIVEASDKALAMLDECRKVDHEARLVYWIDRHEHDEDCAFGHELCPTYNFDGPAVMAEFLDADIVFGVPKS